jgi:hypothetical protein
MDELTIENACSDREVASIMSSVFHCLTVKDEGTELTPDQSSPCTKLLALRSELKISLFDQQFLAFYAQDGLTGTSARKKLGMGTDQASGRFRPLMARIDQAIEKVSLKKEFHDLLD